MHSSTILWNLAVLARLSTASYVLSDDYGSGSKFFSKFSFFTSSDPTHGYVEYVDQNTAQNDGLLSTTSSGATYIGVDHNNVASSSGRQSVRLTSTNTYTHGLIILDLEHMPGSVCGTWPAFWTVGANWPDNGEVDIIEGVNQQTKNSMTLHTTSGCMVNRSGFTGSMSSSNCDVNAQGQATNSGCGVTSSDSQSYGDGFNNNGGGVYATEWTSQAISIWFFPRSSIPSDISSGNPDPTTWGTPAALFEGSCDMDSHLGPQNIIFDITFCGDWAGNVWSSSSCASQANSCQNYVQNNPSAFQSSYWAVNSLKVYQQNGSSSGSLTASSPRKASPTPKASPTTFSTMFPTPSATSFSSGGGSSSCSWLGHCLGAPCATFNDCADPYTCSNGRCA